MQLAATLPSHQLRLISHRQGLSSRAQYSISKHLGLQYFYEDSAAVLQHQKDGWWSTCSKSGAARMLTCRAGNGDSGIINAQTEEGEVEDAEEVLPYEEATASDFDVAEDTWTASVAQASDGALVDTGKQDWGEVGLALARQLLDKPERNGLLLFSFRALPHDRSLHIALDKPQDRFGSPESDELDSFSRDYNVALEASLGAALADNISVEVSSPGAERLVRVPRDLKRFSHLPMTVKYSEPCNTTPDQLSAKPNNREKVFMLRSVNDQILEWNLADVRVNREAAGKGRRLGKKKLQEIHEMELADVLQINLHLDI